MSAKILVLPVVRIEREPPLITIEEAISMGLTMVVPGPPSLIGPHGSAVKQIKEALRLSGYEIVPK